MNKLILGTLIILLLILSVLQIAGAASFACAWRRIDTEFVWQCSPAPLSTATATKAPREKQNFDAGYPAPGDPISEATPTQIEAYPPPPGPEGPTWTPAPTFTAGAPVAQPTDIPRETPTLAPTMTEVP